MSLLVLSAADVKKIVSSFDTKFLQELMARVFIAISSSTNTAHSDDDEIDIQTPHRTSINMPAHVTLFMPARVSFSPVALKGTSVKIVSVPRGEGDDRGLPATSLVLNEETGAVEAVVNARELTPLRNAAGSLLSMTLVGVQEPKNIVMFGAGKQIEAHISLFLRHYPSITTCTIINRSINERAQDLYRRASTTFGRVSFQLLSLPDSSAVKHAMENSDAIVCATSSTSPLFPSSWVPSGTHVMLIGSYKPAMQEVEEELVRRAVPASRPDFSQHISQVLMVDSVEACLKEAGDLIKAGVGRESVVEIGDFLLHHDRDRPLSEVLSWNGGGKSALPTDVITFTGPITLFKSVGVGLQDVIMATEVVSHAKDIPDEIGIRIEQYDAAF